MKSPRFFQSLRILALSAVVSAAHAAAPVMQDAATHQQLSLALRKAQQADPMKSLQPAAAGEDPSVVNRPKSLLAESDIVCFGGLATLVPKRAIIQAPKNFADRMRMQPGARLQPWSEFYAANRGWITTVEVSRVQAEGNLPLAEETQNQIARSGNQLVVAVFRGGPISLLPLKATANLTAQKP